MNKQLPEWVGVVSGWTIGIGVLVLIGMWVGSSDSMNYSEETNFGTQSADSYNEKPSSDYYSSCTEARDDGVENIEEGDEAYRLELDRDGDGIACEPYNP